jgi:hypothetical protein
MVVVLVWCVLSALACTIAPPNWLAQTVLQSKMPPYIEYRALLVGVGVFSGSICYLYEILIIDRVGSHDELILKAQVFRTYANQPLLATCGKTKPAKYVQLRNSEVGLIN